MVSDQSVHFNLLLNYFETQFLTFWGAIVKFKNSLQSSFWSERVQTNGSRSTYLSTIQPYYTQLEQAISGKHLSIMSVNLAPEFSLCPLCRLVLKLALDQFHIMWFDLLNLAGLLKATEYKM